MGAYQIYLFNKNIVMSEHEAVIIAKKIRYYAQEVHDCKWFMCYSDTDSKSAKPVTIKTGKRGRPPKQIKGKKIKPHIHAFVEGQHSWTAADLICKSINRRYGARVTQKTSIGENEKHLENLKEYMIRQANFYRGNV